MICPLFVVSLFVQHKFGRAESIEQLIELVGGNAGSSFIDCSVLLGVEKSRE